VSIRNTKHNAEVGDDITLLQHGIFPSNRAVVTVLVRMALLSPHV